MLSFIAFKCKNYFKGDLDSGACFKNSSSIKISFHEYKMKYNCWQFSRSVSYPFAKKQKQKQKTIALLND